MTKKQIVRLDILLGVLGLLVAVAMPAMAQAVDPAAAPAADPAQQDFLARILIFIGNAMITHAHDWAGYMLLAVPFLAKLIGWMMPREWLFAILKTAATPATAIFKMIAGRKDGAQ